MTPAHRSATTTVAGRFLDALAAAGCDPVFGLPGVHNLAFWRHPPGAGGARIVNVRHEQTAVYAADGYARASGRPGGALVTTGPGAANALAAFGEAAMSKSPVVLVASEVPRRLVEAGVRGALHQSSDQAGLFRPLAKAVWTPRTPQDAVSALAAALRAAVSAPQGPVYVDVPADVLAMPGPAVPGWSASAPVGDEAGLVEASTRVAAAGDVALWAGGGVVQAGAWDELGALARHLQAPVFTTFAARGAVGPERPEAVTLPPHEPEIARVLARCAALIVVGSDLDAMTTKNHTLGLPGVVVDVNADPARVGVPGRRDAVGVVGDARWALEGLRVRTAARRRGRVSEAAAACRRAWALIAGDLRTAEAAALVEVVGRLAADAVVVNDMTVPGYWLGGYWPVPAPRRMQYPMGWGTLGYALPASIGAAVGSARPVLAVCGDGGLSFAVGELATLAQERLAVTVLVMDDAGYGMLRFDQRHDGGPPRGVDLVVPDFGALAGAFGIPAVSVDGVGPALEQALAEALGAGAPRLVHCRAALFPPRTTSPRWDEA